MYGWVMWALVGCVLLTGCAGSGVNIRVESKGCVNIVIEQPRQTEINPSVKADGNDIKGLPGL